MIAPDRVHGIRAVLLGLLRLLAAGLVGYGLYLIGARLAFGLIGNGDLVSAFQLWQGIGTDHGVFRGVPMLVIGVALGLVAKRLVVWIVRPAETGCPRCGYAVEATVSICPECGQGGLGG